MEQKSTGMRIFYFALALGVLFDYLFFDKIVGISLFLFALGGIGVLYLLYFEQFKQNKLLIALSSLLLVFASTPFFRANGFLIFLNVVTILGLGLLIIMELTGHRITLFRFQDYIRSTILLPFKLLGAAIYSCKILSKLFPSIPKHERVKKIILGLLMALPVVFLFTVLLTSADLAFNELVNNAISFNISETVLQHILLILFISIASISVLGFIEQPSKLTTEPQETVRPEEQNSIIEIQVFLWVIIALFLVFIVIQVTYLFGGTSNISELGFTYAEYARRGFLELIAVAMLTLVILLAAEHYALKQTKRLAPFLVPALILVSEVMVIIYSAFKRLHIYQEAYSFTSMRFYVSSIIIFVFSLFVLLSIKLLLKKREQFFALGTLGIIFASVGIITFINPDAFIAKKNIAHFRKTGKIDVNYLNHLSVDALPSIIEAGLPIAIPPRAENKPENGVVYIEVPALQARHMHWQSFNLPTHKALQLLNQN